MVVAVVSVFRSGQNVVVVIDRTSVYPARDRLCVQEWSKCGCGCACWQRVQEWSKCGCGCACWQCSGVFKMWLWLCLLAACSGVVKMWLWWLAGPQCTRPEADPLQQPAGVRQRSVPGLLPGRRAQPALRLHRPHQRHHQTAHDPAILHAAVSVSQPVSQAVS